MALVATVPSCSGAVNAKSNSWIGMACGTRRPVLGRSIGGTEHAKRRPSVVVARAHDRALRRIGIRLAVPGTSFKILVAPAKGRLSMEGGRSCWAVASNLQPDNVDISSGKDPYGETETEDEARKRNWKKRGWAPWEVMLTPEAQFALDSLADGDEDPVVSWDSFQKLNKKQDIEQIEKDLDEAAKKAEMERLKSTKLEGSLWERPLVYTRTPPRDWPPPGWKVDAKELAYIREAHTLARSRVTAQDLEESNLQPKGAKIDCPRWEMFLKQYEEWVVANEHIMVEEALEVDAEYYPGRRRTGDDYKEGMYELPFVYPGQHYFGVVTYVSLYEGAFVYYGGVHDGWVPIMDNDWYEIRHHIKVGMVVHVEVIAKRDPYRFRFPVQLRLVDPNIDHLIFRRFKYPPIFGRREDTNLDEVAREANRPYYPTLRPEPGEEVKVSRVHPYIRRLWLIHEAEKMILEDEESVDDDEDWEDWATKEEDDPTGEWTNEPGIQHQIEEGFDVPTIVLHVDEKYLNLEAARSEREEFKKLRAEAEAQGEEFEEPEGRFQRRMAELNDMHQQRWTEERETLVRDRACRLGLGLPLEEPGRYADKSFWGKNPYDPREPQWRHDYWGDPATIKDEVRKEREPRARTEVVGVDDGDDQLDVLGGDVTMIREEGVDLVNDRGFIYDDADARIIFGESEDRGTVNGTVAKSLTTVRDVFEDEEGDWKFVDNSEVEKNEVDDGDEGGDDITNDDK